MREVGLGIVAFMLGAIAGWAAVMAGYVVYAEMFEVFDREGRMAMGMAFGIGPIVAVACGLAAAVWAVIRRHRRDRRRARVPPPALPRWQRVLLAVVLPAAAAYCVVAIAVWLFGSGAYASYPAALAVSLAPLAAGAAAAVLGWRCGLRRSAADGA